MVASRAMAPLRSACWGFLALALAFPATAQGPDLNYLALDWVRGRFASPVVCEGGGEAARVQRRLTVAPGPKRARPITNRITFHGIDVKKAERCMDVLGKDQPEVRGGIQITLPGHSRPDLAPSEFRRVLRNEGGFDFDITEGRLQLTDWSVPRERRVIDLRGGKARFRAVRRGSDAARILSGYESPQKLTLELEAPEGETLQFQLALYDFR